MKKKPKNILPKELSSIEKMIENALWTVSGYRPKKNGKKKPHKSLGIRVRKEPICVCTHSKEFHCTYGKSEFIGCYYGDCPCEKYHPKRRRKK